MENISAAPYNLSLNQSEKVLFSFTKSAREQVRVSETLFQGEPYIDFRIWSHTPNGSYAPTKKGLTFSKDLAKYLKAALLKII